MPIPDVLTEKVNRLLTLLTCYKLPNDDTLLEKLLNWIDGVVHRTVKCKDRYQDSAWTFLQDISAVDFLKICSTKSDSNVELLTFALKLCCCVVDVYFTELETNHTISALLQNALMPDHWDHPSVRCALLQMLHSVWQTQTGRCWFSQKVCMTQVKRCIVDSSIFVGNAAVKLMSLCIVDPTKDEPTDMDQEHDTIQRQELLDFVMQPLHNDTSLSQGDSNVTQTTLPLQQSLAVLQGVCKDRQMAEMLLCERDLIGCLCKVLLLRTDCAKSYEATLDLISVLFTADAVSEVHRLRLKKMALSLAEAGHFLAALQLTRRLLQSSSKSFTSDLALTELLQSPLKVTVGENQQHLTDALWGHMKHALVDRRAHTQLLRESLTALRDLKLQQDCLPLLAALLTYTQKEADPGSSPLVTNVMGCSKTQQLTLDVMCRILQDDSKKTVVFQVISRVQFNLVILRPLLQCALHQDIILWEPEFYNINDKFEATVEVTLQMFQCCVTFLNSSLTSAAICGKTFHCLCLVLHRLSHLSQLAPAVEGREETAGGVLDQLQVTLQRSLCDMKWETRDSALEFVGSLVSQMSGSDVILEWVIDRGVVEGVWQCVMDGESYVRAAALTSLGHLSEVSRVWAHISVTIGQNDVMEKVTDIIQNDTEAFARRAAIDLLVKLWTHDLVDSTRSHDIEKVMQNAIYDFDWEVKLRVLAFWEQVQGALGPQPVKRDGMKRGHDDVINVLQPLCDCGGLTVLLEAFDDYDKAVQKKACVMLKTLKTSCALNDIEPIPEDAKYSKTDTIEDADAVCQEAVSETMCDTVDICGQDSVNEHGVSETTKKVAGRDVAEFIRWLRSVDLDRVCDRADQSVDGYADNPESLVDDLLTSLDRIEHMTDTEGEESGEENVIDCY